MTSTASESSTGEAQDFLDRVFDRAVRLVEEGRPPVVDELLDGHESLRVDVERLIRLASQIAAGPVRRMPVIDGYKVLHELGHGGMGTVYLARQESLGGRPVALKVLPVSAGLSPRARDRFSFEARAIARLRHPNIVAIHDVLDEDGLCAYAMEWVDGTSLAAWIDDQKHGNKLDSCPPLDVPGVCRLGISIARALAVVHKTGILHRDVKPSNILLRRDGTALLADFGLAREVDSSIHTHEGRFAGTVAYAPPEQLRGDTAHVDARSDIYALGVTLYHALAQRLPFEAREPVAMLRQIESGLSTPLRKLNPRVPRDLETIITKTIDPDPTRRYQTALELTEDLERLLGFQPIHARRAGITTRGLKLLRRNRPAAIGLTIGSVLTILVATGLVTFYFFVPGWVATHVRNARLALLDPEQANSIVSVLYWGHDKPLAPYEQDARRQSLNKSLASYDKALLWSPFDKEIRQEREVVQLASDAATKRRSEVAEKKVDHEPSRLNGQSAPTLRPRGTTEASPPFQRWDFEPNAIRSPVGTTEAPLSLPPDLRNRGLFAFLTHDFDTAIKSWEQFEQSRDPLAQPDPLLDSALGVLYLFKDQPARAYPRLQQAVIAFPGVGFLLEYLADAAAKCGDAERAEHWLNEAKKLTLSDPHGAQNRIHASILAATGHDDEAEALFRNAPPNSPAGIEHARFLESRGRLPEALACYAASASVMHGERAQRAYLLAADRWWARQSPRQRLKRIRAAIDEPPFAPGSLVFILQQYRNARDLIKPSAAKTTKPSIRWSISPPTTSILSISMTLAKSFSSPSLQSLSLSELAQRMEVMDMSLWNRITSYPQFVRDLNFAAWRRPLFEPAARSVDFAGSLLRVAANRIQFIRTRRRALAMATVSLAVLASQPANGQCTTPPCFQGLGDLSGGGSFSATDHVGPLSKDGSTVVGRSISTQGTEAFRWTASTGIVGLGDGPGGAFYSSAFSVSADGANITGITESGNTTCSNQEAFRWSQADGFVLLGDAPGGCFWSAGQGISADGNVVVGVSNDDVGYRASYWSSGSGWVPIGPNPSSFSAVNTNGTFIAGQYNGELYYWTSSTGMINIGDLTGGSTNAYCYGMTPDGTIIFGYGSTDQGRQGLRWTQATGMIALPDLPGGATDSIAYDVSPNGALTVGWGTSSSPGTEAVIWDQSFVISRMTDELTAHGVTVPSGWILTDATGITINNSVVTVCGNGLNPQGNPEVWIARYTLPPTCEAPQVSQHPQSANPAPGATVNLTISAAGTAPLSYQWRKNTVNLNNGASGCSSTISGATTANLVITNVSTTDNGTYDCVVTNACGSDTSDPATLTVPQGPACAGDMDGNNVVNGADIAPFVAKLLAGGACS